MPIVRARCLFVALLLFSSLVTAGAQTQSKPASSSNEVIAQIPSPLSLEVNPFADFPLGNSASAFTFGGGADVDVVYQFPGSVLFAMGGLEYSFVPDQASDTLSLAAARAGVGARFPLGTGVGILAYAAGGYYFATFNDMSANANNPYVGGGVLLQFALNPLFRLGVGAQYTYYAGLYQGVSGIVSTSIALGNLGGTLDIPSVDLRPAFPVFFKYYDDHPVGALEVKSNLKVPATDVVAQIFIKEYMDSPKTVSICGSLAPGESKTAELYALFTDKVLGVTEGTKVAAEITVSYKVEGQTYEDKRVDTLSLLGRNAMTWDDTNKAAAFVTAKEPQVLNFARSVTSFVRARENRAVNDNLQAAIALHEALDLYGINYTRNPVTPFEEVSRQKTAVDFLQFPRETFQYKAGDCSDLSILYSSLLQAVGIDAAFITIPGHIFVAVNTGLRVDQAPDALIPEGQYVAWKGRVWIPVEITVRHQGFVKAWQLGAREWAQNTLTGEAGFYPVQEAWTHYQPVGLPGAETTINVPQSDTVLSAYLQEVQKYLDTALAPQVAALQDRIKSTNNAATMNKLGVLYAKFGQADKAETIFKQALAKKTYLPAMMNLGNLYFLKESWKDALRLYQQASDLAPNDPHVLVALANVNQQMQDYPDLQKEYEKLKRLDPELASQYAFLGQGADGNGARAADIATERRAVIWESEE